MIYDYKKEFKELYSPKTTPVIIDVPKINYISYKGKGNPNEENGEYQKSIKLLYGVMYTIKMSYKTTHKIKGYFDFIVPPLEGLWWTTNTTSIYENKDKLNFISLIRLPEFITEDELTWALEETEKKKSIDTKNIKFLTYEEGKCVECMHLGSYDNEPKTIENMHEYIENNGYTLDITEKRLHHEIYISNPSKCDINKLKTVIRLPIKEKK